MLAIGDVEVGTTDWININVNAFGRYVKVEWVWCGEISVRKPETKKQKTVLPVKRLPFLAYGQPFIWLISVAFNLVIEDLF